MVLTPTIQRKESNTMKLSELITSLQKTLETYGDGKVSTLVNRRGEYLCDWMGHGWVFVEEGHDDYHMPTIQIRFRPQGNKNV